MKKKLIILCFSVFLLSGCTATYDLEINNNTFKEKLTLNEMNVDKEQLEVLTTNALPVDYNKVCYWDFDTEVGPNEVKEEKGINYYKISPLDDGLTAESTMSLSEYPNSRILNTPFVSNHVNNYDDYVSIYGFDGVEIFNIYPELEEFTVNITTDKQVNEHDADEVKGNTYTWKFTPKDTKKTLYIEMDSTKVMKEKKNTKTTNDINFVSFIILGGILVVGLLFAIYMKIKMVYSNKI